MTTVDDVFLRLLSPRALGSPADGQAIIQQFVELTPEWAPSKWGTSEPFEPADLSQLDRYWTDYGLAWEGPGKAPSFARFGDRVARAVSSLMVRSPSGLVDGERASQLLRRLAVCTDALYGYLHHLTPGDLATSESRSARIHPIDGPYMNVGARSLRESGLPNIWWANIFGPAVVEVLGAQRIATAPAHRIEQLGDDLWYLQLTESILDNETDPAAFEAARAEVKAHLGADAFYDPAKGRRGPYRTIPRLPEAPPRKSRSFVIKAHGPDGFTQQPHIRARWEPWSQPRRAGVWDIDLPADALAELVAVLPEDNRTAEINQIPTLDTFARLATEVPFARFAGTVVGPGAGTESVTIEQVTVPPDTHSPTLTHIAPTASSDDHDESGRTLWWT